MSSLVDFKTKVQEYEEKADFLMKNRMLNASYKGKDDVKKALSLAESVGIPWMAVGRTIDVIQGNPALSTKVIAGLLTKNGIAIEVIKDWEPVYEKRKTPITEEINGVKVPKMDENGDVMYFSYKGKPVIKKIEVDRITEVRFLRYYPKIGVVPCKVTMTKSDADLANWSNKNTWRTLPKFLAMARCLSRGARLVGADITGSVYSTDEVVEFTDGVEGTIDEEGKISYVELQEPKPKASQAK